MWLLAILAVVRMDHALETLQSASVMLSAMKRAAVVRI